MSGTAKDWRASLMELFAEATTAYRRLEDVSLGLRRALIQGEVERIRDQVAAHQELLVSLGQLHEQCATLCRQGGLLAAGQPFTVGRLEAAAQVQRDPPLRRSLRELQTSARRSAQQTQHNRYLIARLAEWTEKEMRLVLQPLFESAGYLEDGAAQRGTTRPAMIDRRG